MGEGIQQKKAKGTKVGERRFRGRRKSDLGARIGDANWSEYGQKPMNRGEYVLFDVAAGVLTRRTIPGQKIRGW
jgi:hypothetical protein